MSGRMPLHPACLSANADGTTGTASFDLKNTAATQRWLILTQDETTNFEAAAVEQTRQQLTDFTTKISALAATPHNEEVAGTDDTLNTEITAIESEGETATTVAAINDLISRAKLAGMNFLSNVTARDATQPFDLTFLITNPDFDTDATTGWTSASTPNYGGKSAEFYQQTFDFYQNLSNMPKGYYQLKTQAFQLPGTYGTVYTNYVTNGKDNVVAQIYAGTDMTIIQNIMKGRQTNKLYSDDVQMADNTYISNSMGGAAVYFGKGLYEDSVAHNQNTANSTLRIGIRSTVSSDSWWTIFDNFRLYFYGQKSAEVITGMEIVENTMPAAQDKTDMVYDLTGRCIEHITSPGLYIINNKKIMVK